MRDTICLVICFIKLISPSLPFVSLLISFCFLIELDSAEAMARSAAAYRAGKSVKKVLGHYDELEERAGSLVLGAGGGVEGEGDMKDEEEEDLAKDVGFQSLVIR